MKEGNSTTQKNTVLDRCFDVTERFYAHMCSADPNAVTTEDIANMRWVLDHVRSGKQEEAT